MEPASLAVRELESRTVYLPVLGAIVNVLVLSIYCQGEASKFVARTPVNKPPVNKYGAQIETDCYPAGAGARGPLLGENRGTIRSRKSPQIQGETLYG